MEITEAEARGQANIWKYMFGFVDSMALKTDVELRIADIIDSHGQCNGASKSNPMITLSEIATGIASSPDIMLPQAHHEAPRPPKYLHRRSSIGRWGTRLRVDPFVKMVATWLTAEPRPNDSAGEPSLPNGCMELFSQFVKEGAPCAFKMAHGLEIWDFASENPKFNKMFNDGMACTAKVAMNAIISGYGDGFDGVGTLVDVGGGTGSAVAEIVTAHPNIKGINFDLPHVIVTAPTHLGVSHVGGDMFEDNIPNADVIFMKWIMHDWNDGDCVKILKNCRKSIPETTGKIMIVEIALDPNADGVLDDTRLVFDLLMMAHLSGGKERTENEWKKILEQGGFPRYKIIKIPALVSIIEAYPL